MNRSLIFPTLVAAIGLLGAGTAQPAHAVSAGGCFPACRRGFVCSPSRQCVSACNPACAAGQECSADGQCVAPANGPSLASPAPATSQPSAGFYPSAGGNSSAGGDPVATYQSAGPRPLALATDDPKERRRQARAAWSLHAALGYGETQNGHFFAPDGMEINSLKHEGLTLVLGVSVRKYLTRTVGLQARTSILLGEGKGFVLATPADATVRVGPFGNGFPWFFGVGPFLGSVYVSRTGVEVSNTAANGTVVSASKTSVLGGGIVETGFLFGERDRLEILLRAYLGVGSVSGFDGDVIETVADVGYRF